MKKIFSLFLLLGGIKSTTAQLIDAIINEKEVARIEKVLSSDNMQGRATLTPGIERAANFISSQFKSAGLRTWGNSSSYRQPFAMIKSNLIAASGSFNGQPLDPQNIQAFTSEPELALNQNSGYEKATIGAEDNLITTVIKYIQGDKNYLVLVDTSFASRFASLARFKAQQFKSRRSVVFVLSAIDPQEYEINIKQEITETRLANVVGILPGTTRKNEYVIFSAHYDHLGIGKPNAEQDSIFNGANDDASGTTAVIMLAKYFARKKYNERTLVFAAFTAEEIGGYGSQYFSRQLDPLNIVAMFNIEMIGTESKWGTNSAFITGYEKTDMGKILEKNLEGSRFRFYPDPYPAQQLFYRSDNATLAKQGVPAHTISTSKMDSEKYYHTQDDEIGTLDMKNMAEIIKAIAISSSTIVAGKDAPSRVDTKELK
jgi:hypothetical protein